MDKDATIKKRVGKGGKTQFDPVIYKCKCKQYVMASGFGISQCPKCEAEFDIIPGKNG